MINQLSEFSINPNFGSIFATNFNLNVNFMFFFMYEIPIIIHSNYDIVILCVIHASISYVEHECYF